MPLNSTETVAVPAREYDRWGVQRFELTVDTVTGRVDACAVMRRANADAWSDRTQDAVYVREGDLVAYLLSLPDAPAALAELQAATDALLNLSGRLLDRDGMR